ncbi:MAG: expansin EXLX1 family cellulose-binding protein [Chloroflexaceae bacterium]
MTHMLRAVLLMMAALSALGSLATSVAQPRNTVHLPLVTAGARPQNELRTGRATYYEATGDGNCSFGPSPGDLLVAAISHQDYGNPDPEGNPAAGPAAVYCGAYVEVFGELGSVVVRIVDKCPDALCTRGHLDLSRQAFARIAPLERGIVPITWRVISPELGRNVAYRIKEGSNRWWTAIQVRYHRNPIVKLEYRNAAGQWLPLVRQDYNYFVGRDMGPGPYTLRVTDAYGNVVTDSGIVLGDGVETPGQSQFPPGP